MRVSLYNPDGTILTPRLTVKPIDGAPPTTPGWVLVIITAGAIVAFGRVVCALVAATRNCVGSFGSQCGNMGMLDSGGGGWCGNCGACLRNQYAPPGPEMPGAVG